MAVLIAVYSAERCVGCCDARCYNAQRGLCGCICGGVNHGVGFEQALKNTYEMVDREREDLGLTEQLERYKARRARAACGSRVGRWEPSLALSVVAPAVQLELL